MLRGRCLPCDFPRTGLLTPATAGAFAVQCLQHLLPLVLETQRLGPPAHHRYALKRPGNLHRFAFKRSGNYFSSILLEPSSTPDALSSPDILEVPLIIHLCPVVEDGPLPQHSAMSPTFLPPCSKKTSHPYSVGRPPSCPLPYFWDTSVCCAVLSPGR